ncbi:hypothetical protein [Cupriavidus sp. D39]|uniref:hypothetical protein n=1 Tax=Cupriavidus sp. D39 TaxID=2997877 RepID=UPI0022704743|nr:hypothetical protein [Cupriavidus sp. D39]MCY0853337.1 hypothetical protein [Cupriavidus sp. D39]
MTTPKARLSHFVVLYWVPTGCVIVEVTGPVVFQLGPFPEEGQPQALAMRLFPEAPVILLPPQVPRCVARSGLVRFATRLQTEISIPRHWDCCSRKIPTAICIRAGWMA